MIRLLLGLLWGALAPLAATAQQPSQPDVKKLLAYDKSKPFDMREDTTYERDGVRVVDLTYASPIQGRVPAFLVLPPGKGPFPAVLFGHWGNGNRTEFLPEAELYARAGAISLLVAYPWTRPRPWTRAVPNLEQPELDLEIYAQAVVDLRRGLDLLLSRPDVTSSRVAYVGHSYGAQWGAVLAAVDKRVRAVVLMGGTPTARDVWLSANPETADFVASHRAAVDKYLEVIAPIDAVVFISRAAPTPLLFQFARFEQYFSREAMGRYYRAASEPKEIRWYDTGHDLNDIQCLLDRAAFLEQQIGIKPVGSILARKR